MIISFVNKLFSSKEKLQAKQIEESEKHASKKLAEQGSIALLETAQSQSNAIHAQLLNSYETFLAQICDRTDVVDADEKRSVVNSNKVAVNADGSFIVRNEAGQIVKTCDVLRRLKEYSYDDAGNVMVKKFGIWHPLNGELKDDGTLVNRTEDGEIRDSLDGTLLYLSASKQSLIAQNENTGEEIALNSDGIIRHRYMARGTDNYLLYAQGELQMQSETFVCSRTVNVRTMADSVRIDHVSRIESRYENGKLGSESFTFFNEQNGCAAVRVGLDLPNGELHLSKVQSIRNIFSDGEICETIFELLEPVTVSRDKEGTVSLIRGISKVRRFQIHAGVCAVVFIDRSGDENLFFPAI